MQPYTACVQINRIKILVCGDKGVGKTALIHAFRDDYYTEDPVETDEMVCKIHYVQDQRTLFQDMRQTRKSVCTLSMATANGKQQQVRNSMGRSKRRLSHEG
ncbi:hypothetical protein Aduo_010273 [Ancylostoma duodenale]